MIKFRREGADVELVGLNKASETIVDRFGIHRRPEEIEKVLKRTASLSAQRVK